MFSTNIFDHQIISVISNPSSTYVNTVSTCKKGTPQGDIGLNTGSFRFGIPEAVDRPQDQWAAGHVWTSPRPTNSDHNLQH